MSDIKNVAIIGGTGQIGSRILDNLLNSTHEFHVTAISRAESKTSFPSAVTVKKGDQSSDAFLESALQGIDALIITLSLNTPPDFQTRLIAAAAKAGVAFVLPNEFGSDNANEAMSNAIPINGAKKQYRDEVERLGVSSWIGIVNNPFYGFSLGGGAFGINIKAKSATLYDEGKVKFNTTTRAMVGVAVARLLALPRATLDTFRNKFVYIDSFYINQRETLDSVQRVTGTTDADWNIEQKSAQNWIDESREKWDQGDHSAVVGLIYGHHFKEGLGGDLHATGRTLANELLDLPKEDLDEATAKIVKSLE